MNRQVWMASAKAEEFFRKFRSSSVAVSLLLVSLLLACNASAELAADSPAGRMNDTVLTSSGAGILRGLPYLDACDQYLRRGVFTFYAGKLHTMARHTRYELESTGATVPLIRHVNYIFAQSGVWLGAAWKMPLSDGIRLNAQGWKLLPTRREVYGTYFHNLNPPTPGDLPSALDFWREWSPNTDAWYADLFLTVSSGLDGYVNGVWAVFGGRYDSYDRILRHSLSRGRNIASSKDEMEMSVQMLVPYIGIQVSRDARRYDLTVRMIGTPIVFGGLEHKETFGGIGVRDEGWFPFDVPRGYWAELFVEAGARVTQRVTFGGFLKMTTMTLMSNADITRDSVFGGPPQRENYDLIYRRLMYTFGAKAAVHF